MAKIKRVGIVFAIAMLSFSVYSVSAEEPGKDKIIWEKWSPDIFIRAKKENRFVLLDMEAVWCHWCHVMDEITYADPVVVSLITKRYIAVKVDQDSSPELSNRYEDYGWPATIVFDSLGKELVKRSAYIPPKPMASMLQAVIDDPTPGPSVFAKPELKFEASGSLPEALRKKLDDMYLVRYDPKEKGWGFVHKYLDWDTLEYTLVRSQNGDANAEKMGRETLLAHQALIDPVWGGVYQYSTGGNWHEPHFEKIMQFQAETLRVYSLAYAAWKDPLYLKSAQAIHRYIHTFLTSPDGTFYTSQDADLVDGQHSGEYFKLDDSERRKQGIPRVDTHVYSRDNGYAIAALAALYAASGDEEALKEARTAADWIVKNRTRPGGGYAHGSEDSGDPSLSDNLAMGRAFLALYSVTGERPWLAKAEAAVKFIEAAFKTPDGAGYYTAAPLTSNPLGLPERQREENSMLARLANLLFWHTGNHDYRATAEHAFRYLTAPEVAVRSAPASVLLAHGELSAEPIHFAVVGGKDDAHASALFHEAVKFPGGYKRVEWLDAREAPLPKDYPAGTVATAYICAGEHCGRPLTKPEDVQKQAERLLKSSDAGAVK